MGITTGQDLCDRATAYLAEHPELARQANLHYQTLHYYDPGALLRGGDQQEVEMIYARHALHGTGPDWGAMGAADLGFAVGLAESAAAVVKLPVDLVCWLVKLVEDPQSTRERL